MFNTFGVEQLCSRPTRDNNLLDVVGTDDPGAVFEVNTAVAATIAATPVEAALDNVNILAWYG